jgi:hypothetical protein
MTNISCFSKHNTKLVHVCLIFNTFHILLKKHKNLDFFAGLGLLFIFFKPYSLIVVLDYHVKLTIMLR